MSRDTDLLVDIELPDDIAAGFDEGGLPIAVPSPKAADAAHKEADADRVPTLAELEQARRERDELARRAESAERTAQERERALTEAQTATESERRSRAEAERRASERELGGATAHYRHVNSELQRTEDGIASFKVIVAQAEEKLQAAIESGDPARQARANSELMKATADLTSLEQMRGQWGIELDRAKRVYEDTATRFQADAAAAAKAKEAKPEPEKKADPTPQPPTPEQWIESVRGVAGEKVADWLKTNRQFVTDEKLNRKLMRFADEYVDDHGQGALRTEGFLEALSAKFIPKPRQEAAAVTQETTQDDDGGEEIDTSPTQAQPSRTATASAPVSRSAVAGKPSGSNAKVRLSPAEAQAAEDLFGPGSSHNLSPAEARKAYAINKLRAERDGKYSLNPQAQQ